MKQLNALFHTFLRNPIQVNEGGCVNLQTWREVFKKSVNFLGHNKSFALFILPSIASLATIKSAPRNLRQADSGRNMPH